MALSVQLFVVVCTITYVQCATTTVDTTTETSTTLPTTMKSTTAAKQSTLISHLVASSSGPGSQISAVTSGGSSPQISAVTSGGSSPQITTAPVPKTVNSSNSGLGNGSQQLVTPMVLLMFSVVIVLSFIL